MPTSNLAKSLAIHADRLLVNQILIVMLFTKHLDNRVQPLHVGLMAILF